MQLKKNVVISTTFISTATDTGDAKALLTNTGQAVSFMTMDVKITMDVPTMAASKMKSLSLNGLIATQTLAQVVTNVVICLEITINA